MWLCTTPVNKKNTESIIPETEVYKTDTYAYKIHNNYSQPKRQPYLRSFSNFVYHTRIMLDHSSLFAV